MRGGGRSEERARSDEEEAEEEREEEERIPGNGTFKAGAAGSSPIQRIPTQRAHTED